MIRAHWGKAVFVLGLAALVGWIASKTYWDDVEVPMPLRGEAVRNPFYAAQRFAGMLGARTAWHRRLSELPPRNGTLVLASWHWSVSAKRRQAIERWVENGGRLMVDRSLIDGSDEFERWSGIAHFYPERDDEEDESPVSYEKCRALEPDGYEICELDGMSVLTSDKAHAWTLRDELGVQALRVAVGRGSVTAINAQPFQYREFLEGDHAQLFVAATQMQRGDTIYFLSEEERPSLLALLWQYGSPVVTLLLAVIALALWRGSVRFGPLAAATESARRSLAEQIRGTGRFAMRVGHGEALHRAAVRALHEAARRRIPAFEQMPATERLSALASSAELEAEALASASQSASRRRPHELRHALDVLETARRKILIRKKRS